MLKLRGTYCAALTPLTEDFTINKKLFLDHCYNLLSQDLDGLAIFGTTGEANSFNVNEKIDVMNYLVENNINPEKLLPGTGQCSVKDTVLLSKSIANLNVKSILVLPPFYYKNVNDEGVIDYYKRVIEEVAENKLNYILYNIPQVSGVTISLEIIEKLIKLYPKNILAMKDSSGNIDNMLKIVKYFKGFSLFSGSDTLALKVFKNGGAGAITSVSNISGRLLSYIFKNYKNESKIKNFQSFQELQTQIRETVLTHEPISVLKAYLSVKNNNENWNRVNPPLTKITKPKNHKTVIALIEIIKKMDKLLPVS